MVLQSYIPMAMGCILLCLPHYLCMFFPSNVTMVIPLTIVWNCITFKQICIISHRTIFSWGQSSCFGGETSKREASIILQLLDGKKMDGKKMRPKHPRSLSTFLDLQWWGSVLLQRGASFRRTEYVYIYICISMYIYNYIIIYKIIYI